ncbi:hypothetical protein C5D07_01970 [Rathayibacter tritici]|uniref:T3SS effector HopA1 family protein n=1 Tax=Rathayibacter tritici TaxID=33888 RepID=UPI000CE83EAD|nr:T3SS effector HopA1 family protein [Rathayibacter tritici]PPI19318.1 hypothetical protein C5D07_01970 [Rathayibacter tritici]
MLFVTDTRKSISINRILHKPPAIRPAISPGYFLAESSRPIWKGSDIFRLYLHVPSVEIAKKIWGTALEFLEHHGAEYRAKVLTAAEFYPRRDAMVIYLRSSERETALELGRFITATGDLSDATSAFAERIAPGVALAMEPRDSRPGRQGLSFGQHRATAVAAALLAAADRPESRTREVIDEFTRSGIDPNATWRNLTQ